MEDRTKPFQLTALSVNLNVIPSRLAECAKRLENGSNGSELDLVFYELVAIQLLLLGAKVWLRSSSGIHLGLQKREDEIVRLMIQAEKQIAAAVSRLDREPREKRERRERGSAKLHA